MGSPEVDTPVNAPSNSTPAKHAPGASWANQETQQIPKNRLAIVFSGLMLCIFLAAIDQVRHYFFSGRGFFWIYVSATISFLLV